MNKKTTSLFAASLALLSLSLQADHHGSKPKMTSEEDKPAVEAKTPDLKVEIKCNDTMKFDKTAFEVEVGKTVELTLTNEGNLPKAAMGHNLVILKPGTDVAAFAGKAMTAPQNEYIPTDEEAAAMVFAHTKVLGPAESDVITFTPTEAGVYEYICSFPGHFAIMRGTMTVK